MSVLETNLRRINEINQSIQTLYYRAGGIFSNSLLESLDTTQQIRDIQEDELLLLRGQSLAQLDVDEGSVPQLSAVKSSLEQIKDDPNEDAMVRLSLMYQRLLQYASIYKIEESQRNAIQENLNEATSAVAALNEYRTALEAMQDELVIWNHLGVQGGVQGEMVVAVAAEEGEDVARLIEKEEAELAALSEDRN
ncbi:hypothetical protein KL907_000706 [Ogataea polymorpha]|uniref:Uncharacterized protein n=1 Tax=Ogataea polymorpha TaxID=460523 RepID=A0A1B7SIH6_9ASCO|nr:uncharacterized protein OGAPODRAFT_7541 [Ogataea polymorpha]KAG7882101.1 hypothetical protein KL937_000672 [Ogataea polymorpha]KAG7891815.1 hypothetical protein KL936_001758 [Ogataea polymorpha]KAG7895168.1 hypothetical protein KL908_001518 [Ogataea polymorpha]KAG7911662.1 hypothetical protein KL906_000983 [Ogataea polymorpha]KAG7912504.1 hypothetical protein KL907_000706 [Ogataea polymorpha]